MRNLTALVVLMIATGFAHGDPPATDAPSTVTQHPCATGCDSRAEGYAWAEQQDIEDADDCVGPSPAFVEGCRTYVEENHPSVYNGDGRF